MAIPSFTNGGVLPPFLGSEPGQHPSGQSPYRATCEELVHRFGTTDRRNKYLRGLLDLREHLRSISIIGGVQWVDGSFVEDKEVRGEIPGDIDIVTLLERPPHLRDDHLWSSHLKPHLPTILDKGFCKTNYNCDAFYIDLGVSGVSIARQSAYWFGLFSHQRATFLWKGIVEVPLGLPGVDDAASLELGRRGF